ncbi:UNVERIFIED_CONTAM: hypothetical protein GTU68_025740, partial [Idotea baltica]|nr:hypothetical protein [Idotea baltica]
MKPGKTGLSRIIDATTYSIKGVRHSWKNEAAFRQELVLACILFPAAFYIGKTGTEIALLILCLFIVLITELINSAIEAIVDKTSPELHPLAGAAKDCGSAAVCFSLIATLTVWG